MTPAAKPEASVDNDAARALREDGYVVLPSLLSPRAVAAIAGELEPHFAATPRCVGDFHGWKTTRVNAVLTKAPSVRGLLLHDAVWPAAQAVLGQGCDYVQLNLVQAVRVHPGERAQVPHRDEEMWPVAKNGQPWQINVMWAIDDFTEENGATRLWPRSHRDALDRAIDPAGSVAAAMPRGSACMFMGSLTHGAGANMSGAHRTGIIVSYCLGWLKTYENQYLTYPPQVARSFEPALQQLIGYRMHRPNLGNWNGQDPSVLFGNADPNGAHADALPPEIVAELRAYYDAA
ncbi:MAG: phytanoyl-CoA dioxygenase family protein [Hyphomonadaceae bacterium]|nr:phytanoyl-CoA dioxygenase family protein [Hyphomonadaceae bacterium]